MGLTSNGLSNREQANPSINQAAALAQVLATWKLFDWMFAPSVLGDSLCME